MDASLYWLHTMLRGGEDPKFVARRMIILASEDIGLADPAALGVAVDAFRALEVVGLPEASYALSEAVVYLAAAPKSNSMKDAIARSVQAVEATPGAQVPPHLRSAVHEGQKELGDGVGYVYPHDVDERVVRQQYLPDGATELMLYRPVREGDEEDLADRVEAADDVLGKHRRER